MITLTRFEFGLLLALAVVGILFLVWLVLFGVFLWSVGRVEKSRGRDYDEANFKEKL